MTDKAKLLGILLAFWVTMAPATEIWLGPQQNSADFREVFRDATQWKRASSAISVFKVYGNPFVIPAPAPELKQMVKALSTQGIRLAVETGVMNVGANPRPSCGGWGLVEGYGPVALHEAIVRKIKDAGGEISYIAMDEPLWYGHYSNGKAGVQPGCKSSIDTVAKQAAESLAVYIKAFPGVQIVDVEPSNVAAQPNWTSDYAAWLKVFREQVGRPIVSLQIDAGWTQPHAKEDFRRLYDHAVSLKSLGRIKTVGIIYTGNPTDRSSKQWVDSARESVRFVEAQQQIHPDEAVLQSWHRFPDKILPESNPETMAGLVDFYLDRPWK